MSACSSYALPYLWNITNASFAFENIWFRWQSTIKNYTLGKWFNKTHKKDILFIDVSKNKTIVLDSSNLQNTIITDRAMLDACLNNVKTIGNYAVVLCNIDLTLPTIYDDNLLRTVSGMQRIAVPQNGTSVERQKSFTHNFSGGYCKYNCFSYFSCHRIK